MSIEQSVPLLFERHTPPQPVAETSAASTYQVTSTHLKPVVAKVVLAAQAILAILANIPLMRSVIVLIQKSITALSSLLSGAYLAQSSKYSWVDVAFAVTAIGLAALGLASVIIGNPNLLIAATIAEATLLLATAIRIFNDPTKERKECLIPLFYTVVAVLSLVGMILGNFPLTIAAASLGLAATLVLVGKSVYQKKWFEAGCYTLMTGAQSWGLATQVSSFVTYEKEKAKQEDLRRRWQQILERMKDKKTTTGFQEKWQFPSDHLPIGYECNGVRVLSWNVCNKDTTAWLPGMKLDRSLIGVEDTLVPGSLDGLTVRDVHVREEVLAMLGNGDVLALQECSGAFIADLKQHLPANFQLVMPSAQGNRDDFNVTIYNTSKLHLQESLTGFAYPNSDPARTVTTAIFDELVVVNAHVPGNPQAPGVADLTEYVSQFGTDRPVMSIGDNNFGPWEAPQKEGFYAIPAAYPTHSGAKVHERDTAYLDWCISNQTVRPLSAEQVRQGLSQIVRVITDTAA